MSQQKQESTDGNKQQDSQQNAQVFDLLNFKGVFFENEHQKYICPVTGAHFEYNDLCRRMNTIKQHREMVEIKDSYQKLKQQVQLRKEEQNSQIQALNDTNKPQIEDHSLNRQAETEVIGTQDAQIVIEDQNDTLKYSPDSKKHSEIAPPIIKDDYISPINKKDYSNLKISSIANDDNLKVIKPMMIEPENINSDPINLIEDSQIPKLNKAQSQGVKEIRSRVIQPKTKINPNLKSLDKGLKSSFNNTITNNGQLSNLQSGIGQSSGVIKSQQDLSQNQNHLFTKHDAQIEQASLDSITGGQPIVSSSNDHQKQTIQKLDKITQKIGFQNKEFQNQQSSTNNQTNSQERLFSGGSATKGVAKNLQNGQKTRNLSGNGSMDLPTSISLHQKYNNNIQSNLNNPQSSLNKTSSFNHAYTSNMQHPNNTNSSYVLAPPIDHSRVLHDISVQKKSKFSIKQPGAPPLYQQSRTAIAGGNGLGSGGGMNQASSSQLQQNDTIMQNQHSISNIVVSSAGQGQKHAKDSIMNKAIENYKKKKKEEIFGYNLKSNMGRNNQRAIITKMVIQNISNSILGNASPTFKSFDDQTNAFQNRQSILEAASTQSMVGIQKSKPGTFQTNASIISQTKNGNMLRISPAPKPKQQKFLPQPGENIQGQNSNNISSLSIFTSKKGNQGSDKLLNHESMNFNVTQSRFNKASGGYHRKINSYQGMNNSGNHLNTSSKGIQLYTDSESLLQKKHIQLYSPQKSNKMASIIKKNQIQFPS